MVPSLGPYPLMGIFTKYPETVLKYSFLRRTNISTQLFIMKKSTLTKGGNSYGVTFRLAACMVLIIVASGRLWAQVYSFDEIWPYHSSYTYLHNSDTTILDSTLDNYYVYHQDADQYLIGYSVFEQSNVKPHDTTYLVAYQRDNEHRRIEEGNYLFDNSQQRQNFRDYEWEYHPSGTLKRKQTDSYGFSAPYEKTRTSVLNYSEAGLPLADTTWAWIDGNWEISNRQNRSYTSDLLTEDQLFTRVTVNQVPNVLTRTKWIKNSYDSNGKKISEVSNAWHTTYEELAFGDSLLYLYDAQGREIRVQWYDRNSPGAAWDYRVKDTVIYDDPAGITTRITYNHSNGAYTPNRRFQEINTAVLYETQEAKWDAACSCWNTWDYKEKVFDQFGREVRSHDRNYLLSGELSGQTLIDYVYFGSGDTLKQRTVFQERVSSNFKDKFSILYSLNSQGTLSTAVRNSLNARVFPNPATDKITISLPAVEPASFELYNSQGQIVNKQHIHGSEATLSLPDVPVGVYHYRIQQGDQMAHSSLVIR